MVKRAQRRARESTEKGGVVRKRLILTGLLVVGLALSSGCELLDEIIGPIPGSGTPGGDVIGVSITYWLMATISEQLASDGPITTYVGPIAAGFQPDGGTYNKAGKTFTSSWDGGDYSDTYMEVRLSTSEDAVDFFWVRQAEERWSPEGPWRYVDEFRGYNFLHSYWSADRTVRTYEVVGMAYNGATYDLLTYEKWDNYDDFPSRRHEWVNSYFDIIPDPDTRITIRVTYSEPQP
jgi:hypothetical protein